MYSVYEAAEPGKDSLSNEGGADASENMKTITTRNEKCDTDEGSMSCTGSASHPTKQQKRRAEVRRFKRREQHRQFRDSIFRKDDVLFLFAEGACPLPEEVASKYTRMHPPAPLIPDECDNLIMSNSNPVAVQPSTSCICPFCGNSAPHDFAVESECCISLRYSALHPLVRNGRDELNALSGEHSCTSKELELSSPGKLIMERHNMTAPSQCETTKHEGSMKTETEEWGRGTANDIHPSPSSAFGDKRAMIMKAPSALISFCKSVDNATLASSNSSSSSPLFRHLGDMGIPIFDTRRFRSRIWCANNSVDQNASGSVLFSSRPSRSSQPLREGFQHNTGEGAEMGNHSEPFYIRPIHSVHAASDNRDMNSSALMCCSSCPSFPFASEHECKIRTGNESEALLGPVVRTSGTNTPVPSRTSTSSSMLLQTCAPSVLDGNSNNSHARSRYHHFSASHGGMSGALPLPLHRQLLTGINLAQFPKNYLRKESRYRTYQLASGFRRNHREAMIQLIKAAVSEERTVFGGDAELSVPSGFPRALTIAAEEGETGGGRAKQKEYGISGPRSRSAGGTIAIRPVDHSRVRIVCSSDIIPKLFHLPQEQKEENDRGNSQLILCARLLAKDLLLLYTPDLVASETSQKNHRMNPQWFSSSSSDGGSDNPPEMGASTGGSGDPNATNTTAVATSGTHRVIRTNNQRITTPESLHSKAILSKLLYHILHAAENEEKGFQQSTAEANSGSASSASVSAAEHSQLSDLHGSLVPVCYGRGEVLSLEGDSTSSNRLSLAGSPAPVFSDASSGYIRTLTLDISGANPHSVTVPPSTVADRTGPLPSTLFRTQGSPAALLPRPITVYTGVDIPIISDDETGLEGILKVVEKGHKRNPFTWWLEAFMARVPLITYLDASGNNKNTSTESNAANTPNSSSGASTFVSDLHRITVNDLQESLDPHLLNTALDFTIQVLQFLSVRCTEVDREYFLVNRHHRLELIETGAAPGLTESHPFGFGSSSFSANKAAEMHPYTSVTPDLEALWSPGSPIESANAHPIGLERSAPFWISSSRVLLLPPSTQRPLLAIDDQQSGPCNPESVDGSVPDDKRGELTNDRVAFFDNFAETKLIASPLQVPCFERYLNKLKDVRCSISRYVDASKKQIQIFSPASGFNTKATEMNIHLKKSLVESIHSEMICDMQLMLCGLVDLEALYRELLSLISSPVVGTPSPLNSSLTSSIWISSFLTFYFSEMCDIFGDVVLLLLWDSVSPYLASDAPRSHLPDSPEGLRLPQKSEPEPLPCSRDSRASITAQIFNTPCVAIGTRCLLRKLTEGAKVEEHCAYSQEERSCPPTLGATPDSASIPSTLHWLRELVREQASNVSKAVVEDSRRRSENSRCTVEATMSAEEELVEGYSITAKRLYDLYERFSKAEDDWWVMVKNATGQTVGKHELNQLGSERKQWRAHAMAAADRPSAVKAQQVKQGQISYFLGKHWRRSPSETNLNKALDSLKKAIASFSACVSPSANQFAAEGELQEMPPDIRECSIREQRCVVQHGSILPRTDRPSDESTHELRTVSPYAPLLLVPKWVVHAVLGDALAEVLFKKYPPNITKRSLPIRNPKISLERLNTLLPFRSSEVGIPEEGEAYDESHTAGEAHRLNVLEWRFNHQTFRCLLTLFFGSSSDPETGLEDKSVTHTPSTTSSPFTPSCTIPLLCVSRHQDAMKCATRALNAYSRASVLFAGGAGRGGQVGFCSFALVHRELVLPSSYMSHRDRDDCVDDRHDKRDTCPLRQCLTSNELSAVMKVLQRRLLVIVYALCVAEGGVAGTQDRGHWQTYTLSEVVKHVECALMERSVEHGNELDPCTRSSQRRGLIGSLDRRDVCRALLRSIEIVVSQLLCKS